MAIARVHAVFRCRLFPVNVQIAGNTREHIPSCARAQTLVHFARHGTGNLQKTENIYKKNTYIHTYKEKWRKDAKEINQT